MRRGSNWLVVVLGALVLGASPAGATDDQNDCTADELKEIGRYSKKLYKCLSKATRSGSGAGDCLADASSKFSDKLKNASNGKGCKIPTDFRALDLGLQARLNRDANGIQQSLKGSYALIKPCEVDRTDVYEVQLFGDELLEARVDTIDDPFYFDPGLSLLGVTNAECIPEDRPLSQLMETEFECSFDPQQQQELACEAGPNQGVDCASAFSPTAFCETSPGARDGVCAEVHPDGFCPALQITAGRQPQICSLEVFVEGSCEDDSRGDYRLDVFINGTHAVPKRVESNVAR